MKIQEMKSGISHLNRRMKNEGRDNVFEMRPVNEEIVETDLPPASTCELEEPRWSVVSFDQMEAGGLTYKQATDLMSELDSHKVPGLCIVTDDAASRMLS